MIEKRMMGKQRCETMGTACCDTARVLFCVTVLVFFVWATDAFASETFSLDDVVITASRVPEKRDAVAAKIEIITRQDIENMAGATLDTVLRDVAGVTSNRTSTSQMRTVVGMRGLGSFEQGRTLVLMDGIPINKTDSGGVNWNSINPDTVERIEVFKGPGSSVYGSNAMGGVINIISKRSAAPCSGAVATEVGSHGTWGGRFNVAARKDPDRGFNFALAGMYRETDGWEAASDHTRKKKTDDGYGIMPLYLDEWSISPQVGYDFNELNHLKLDCSYYYDERSEGVKGDDRDDGEYRHFKNRRANLTYSGGMEDKKWETRLYYQLEEYYKLYDRIGKTDTDVDSDRSDMGGILHYSSPFLAQWNRVGIGADIKQGGVDAQDLDRDGGFIKNSGDMRFYALYLDDRLTLADDRLTLSLGLRYDYIETVDCETSTHPGHLFSGYVDGNPIKDENWDALSPRISGKYLFSDRLNAYGSYSRGFRAPELDDLCRTGWQYVGPKIANPNLKPETIDTFELGASYTPVNKLTLSGSAFYSLGKDFLYYVDTGIPVGSSGYWATQTYKIKQNVGEVTIHGIELAAQYNLTAHIRLKADYTYADTEIKEYEKPDFSGATDLTGKELRSSPAQIVNLSAVWENRVINSKLNIRWKDEQYLDDVNSENKAADSYVTADIKFWKSVGHGFTASLSVENIFDDEHTETSQGSESVHGVAYGLEGYNPGRVVTAMLKYQF
ncbi:MAG: TonB-dependent receptor [Desulfobacterium sp.]|nr:TonB-dependent receptor [Desulfobacterium sp.]